MREVSGSIPDMSIFFSFEQLSLKTPTVTEVHSILQRGAWFTVIDLIQHPPVVTVSLKASDIRACIRASQVYMSQSVGSSGAR